MRADTGSESRLPGDRGDRIGTTWHGTGTLRHPSRLLGDTIARYLVSDHHFGHANIIEYCDRPFSSVGEMDSAMLDRLYETVGPEDVLLHLGDVAMDMQDGRETVGRMDQLDADLLVRGNHDVGLDPEGAPFPVVDAAVVDRVTDAFPATELRSKQERAPTVTEDDVLADETLEELTERQRATLEAAYRAEYFEWPRESTAEELVDSMDVTSPTVHNHLRKAEQRILERFFSEE